MCRAEIWWLLTCLGGGWLPLGTSEISRGAPCIKRMNQLYCPSPGQKYPRAEIETFVSENKALIRRMFGDYESAPSDAHVPHSFQTYDGRTIDTRAKRAAPKAPKDSYAPSFNRVDACESSVEITTPYWASNSAGKLRAIVNTKHLQQAIHQEVCGSERTRKCSGECSCEQKYKWHRLMAYDPDEGCKGIFMDWFLFPSCCVCRCNPPTLVKTK